MFIPSAAAKIARSSTGQKAMAQRAATAVRGGRSITRANRARALGISPPKLNNFQRGRVKGTQFYKNHKKLVIGGGALALGGTAFSNNTGVGSSKGTPAQARGIYGF